MARTLKAYRFSDRTIAALEEIALADQETTAIRPTETAIVELAIEELRRRKVGRRHADRAPVRRRGSAR